MFAVWFLAIQNLFFYMYKTGGEGYPKSDLKPATWNL